MKNVKYTVDGSKLTIEVDLAQEHGASGSGKSLIVATSEGIKPVDGTDLQLGFNLFRKNPNYKSGK